jgi:choline dehydrogenase-like flavoprotein
VLVRSLSKIPQAGPLMPPTYEIGDNQDGYCSYFAAVQNPQARGELRLRSAHPDDLPLINPNYLGHEYDVLILIDAVRKVLEYMETPNLKKYIKNAILAPVSSSDTDIMVCYAIFFKAS